MNRDNVLFLVIGALTGFILGYVMHEVMAARQPPPRHAGTGPAGQAQPGAGPGAGQAAGPQGAAAGPQAAMESVQRLRAYVEQNPDDAAATLQLANLNYDISNWSRAAELYERYLKLVPDSVEVMADLGAAYRFLGRPQDALAQFAAVREVAPDYWQARFNEVLVLTLDLEDLPAAEAAMQELLGLQPDNPDVLRLAAEVEKRAAGG
ncbi:MAG: tetratricopeptide repeat protein [Acidobacteriota bacterium]